MKRRLGAHQLKNGFTIVELLIVIVVIAILAAITIVAYNGITQRANTARTTSDLQQLHRAILAARVSTGKTLFQIINSGVHTGAACVGNGPGADLTTMSSTHACWVSYRNAITAIEDASGANLSSIKNGDHRGIPYYIDQNEAETVANNCVKDLIGSYVNPLPNPSTPTYVWVANRIDITLTGQATC